MKARKGELPFSHGILLKGIVVERFTINVQPNLGHASGVLFCTINRLDAAPLVRTQVLWAGDSRIDVVSIMLIP